MALKWSLFFFFVSILQYVFPIVHDEIQLNFKNSKDCNFYCDKKVNNQNFPCIFKHCNNDNKESNTTDLLYRNWLEPGLCLEIHHKKDWKSNVDFCEKIAKIIAKPDDSPTSDKDNIIDSPKNIADKVDGESPGSAKPDDSPTSDKDNSKDSSKKIADKVDGESPGSAKPDDSPTSDKEDNSKDSSKKIADKVDGESPGSAKTADSSISDKENFKDPSKKTADNVDGESPGSAKPDDSPTSDQENIIDSPKNIADKVDGESPGSAKPDDSPTSDKDNSKDSSKKIADKVDGESPGSGNHEPKTKITTKGIESKSTNLKSIPEQQQKEVNSKLDKDHDESHFFIYFFVISLLLLLFYFVIYNKKKVMALFIEGRRKRGRYKPLPKKVDFTLEEAMASESLVSSNNSFPY